VRIINVVLLVVACVIARNAVALELGEAVGPVALVALEGHPRTMENYAEHRCTLVVFMSSRCAETRAQVGVLKAINALDLDEQMLIVGISANPADSSVELKAFLQRNGVVFPVYRDVEGRATMQFGARVTPSAFLLGRKGELLYRGDLAGAQEAVKATLADKKIAVTENAAQGAPLDAPGTPDTTENPYPGIAFSSETIFEEIPGAPTHHCSTLAEAPNGDLVCVWYGGSYESAEDQVLFIARQAKGARDWSAPSVLINNPDAPPGNAIIFRGPNDTLWVVWSRMQGSRPTRRGTGWSKCALLQRSSTDNGLTWSADVEIPDSLGWLPRNPPLMIDGTLYLPLSVSRGLAHGGMLARFDATGATWTPLGMLIAGEQLSIAPRADGSLFGVARSMPFTLQSVSKDRGATWEKASPTTLKCPDSSVGLLRLRSGRFLLAHNDNNGWDRANLTIHQSDDEGRTWGEPRVLEQEQRLEDGEYSYPCLIETSDGRIHLTYTFRRYTIKHATFNEAWLTQVVRPN